MPQVNYLCHLCSNITRRTKVFDLKARRKSPKREAVEHWPHYADKHALKDSAHDGCHLCCLLEMQCFVFPPGQLTLEFAYRPGPYKSLECGILNAEGNLSSAGHSLSVYRDESELSHRRKQCGSWCSVSTASNASLRTAKSWLEACLSHHEECSEQGVFPRTGPERLLMLSRSVSDGQPTIRLVENVGGHQGVNYLTLSYCWGPVTEKTLKLLRSNREAFLKGISAKELPRTLLDAVDITLRLGYRALWIDALCIIQDHAEDWRSESARMGQIYANSICTIAALTGVDSDSGCYAERNPLAFIPCDIQTGQGDVLFMESARSRGLSQKIYPVSTYGGEASLQKRGWVIQERALSPRTLYYSSIGIYWECCTDDLSEFDTPTRILSHRSSFATGKLKTGVSRILRNRKDPDNSWRSQQWHEQWWHLIQIYTRCKLTYTSDRWVAVSGLANMFQLVNGSPITYGMWEAEMMKEMLWEVINPWSTNSLEHTKFTTQPSWSWLSINHAVRINGLVLGTHGNMQFTAQILSLPARSYPDIHRQHLSDEQGHFVIKMQAPMCRYRVRQPPNEGNFLQPWPQNGRSDEIVQKAVEKGEWKPDHIDIGEVQEIWALQWTIEDNGIHALVVVPRAEDITKWRRIGQVQVNFGDAVEKRLLGETKVIELT